ncbi:MAG: SGNH/GDSL hydrolase family protein [Prevotella sp.]|nr:SGNH/GDSL hydrolase family protein [Prevotella sp.]
MKKTFLMIVVAMVAVLACAQDHAKMNVVILGDANTALGGDDCTGERGWTKWFKEAFAPATCISYARAGATWTNNALTKRNTEEKVNVVGNSNVIYNQVNRLKDIYKAGEQPEPSLIIVACGTYDAWFDSKRPEMFDMSASKAFKTSLQDLLMKKVHQVTSLSESVRYNCEILRDAFPDSRIVLVTPLQSVSAGEAKIKKVSDVIEDCGKRLSFTVIRLDKDGCVKFADERIKKHYTKEGNLTSVEGAKLTGELIAERLK